MTHRACTVDFAPDHTYVGVSKDWYYLIPVPGICGFTSHDRDVHSFTLAGVKSEYHDTEIQEIPGLPGETPEVYKGSISISKEKKRVIVKLSRPGGDQKDYPFELNGRYRYH